jgi:osmoprotectant transport system permease protein
MSFLGQVFDWFDNADHWTGSKGIVHRLAEHVQLSAVSLVVAALIALPVGIWLGHIRKGGAVAVNVSNIGRAVPSFALLILMVQLLGLKDPTGLFSILQSVPTFVALVALAIPPIVTNAYVGLAGVDADVREAARGMGMGGWQVLWKVELPMAVPLVMAGLRTSAVAVVATATLAAYIGWGGLGRYIIDGLAVQDDAEVWAGALIVAVLAIVVELGLALVQRLLVSRGLVERNTRATRGGEEVVLVSG